MYATGSGLGQITMYPGTTYELVAGAMPLDYRLIFGDSRVLFLGEDHRNTPITQHIVDYAPTFQALGVSDYCIEASITTKDSFDRYNQGQSVDLRSIHCGPGLHYRFAVEGMRRQGVRISPIDIDQTQHPTPEEREEFMFQRLLEVLKRDLSAKVLVRIGLFHAVKKIIGGIPSLRTRLVNTGIPVRVAALTGGQLDMPKVLLGAVVSAGLSTALFMVDLQPFSNFGVPYGAGEVDFAIHLPQDHRYTNGPNDGIDTLE